MLLFWYKMWCVFYTHSPSQTGLNHISSASYPHSVCGHHIIRSRSHLLRRLREGWKHPGTAPPIWQHGALCCGPQGNGANTCEPLLSPRRDGVHFSDYGTSPSQQPVHGRGCPHFIGAERGLNRFSNCAKWPECCVVGWIWDWSRACLMPTPVLPSTTGCPRTEDRCRAFLPRAPAFRGDGVLRNVEAFCGENCDGELSNFVLMIRAHLKIWFKKC